MAPRKTAVEKMVDRWNAAGKEISDGSWFKFGEPGSHIIGRVLGAQPPSANVRSGLVKLVDVAGVQWAVGLGGNLQSLLKDRADLRGAVIGIMFEVQDDPDPERLDAEGNPFDGMKHYKVVDFGREFPDFAEPAETAEPLPF